LNNKLTQEKARQPTSLTILVLNMKSMLKVELY